MSYPKVSDENFFKIINKKYKSFTVPKKKQSFREICYPPKYQLQLPQKFLSQYINPKTPYTGVLVFHQIGSGKTCAAIRIAEAWKHLRKIIVVVPASLKGNFRNELRSLCTDNAYLSPKQREILNETHPSSDEYKKIIEKSNKKINEHYDIYSYNKFVELAESNKIKFTNSVLIIDEIQNMISEEGKYYDILYKTIMKAPKDLRVVLLSATPMFDKPLEIALTLNLLRIPFKFPTGKQFEKMFMQSSKLKDGSVIYTAKNLDIFKERVKGYISYFKGAPEYTFPQMIIKYIKCPMDDFQYRVYATVSGMEGMGDKFKEFKEKYRLVRHGQVVELPNNFFIGPRIVSNIAFPNNNINENGLASLKGKKITQNLQKYSVKFYKILRKIKRCKGKVFIYSNFKNYGGLESFIKVLEEFGYSNYTETGEGRKRYAVWNGDVSMAIREEIRAVYNRKENIDGSKIKIILGSSAIKEGVTLLDTMEVHIMEPYWNYSRIEQIIGRAVRFCAHKRFVKEDRLVKVFIYVSTHPNEKETVDQYIAKLAIRKDKLISQFEMALKEIAIDCTLFKNANNTRGEKIKCQV